MKLRAIAAISLGNILEWFDFALFVYLAPILGKQFFPSNSSISSTLLTFAVFGAGFICRPVGGILFGYIGDQFGRAKALTISILTISLSTSLVGLLPNFSMIGWPAPLIFTLLRFIHGLSVGGEYTGAIIYLGESADAGNKGFFASFAIMGANLGFLLATLVSMLLTSSLFSLSFLSHWGWRGGFILSGVVGFSILYHRLRLKETAVFLKIKSEQKIRASSLYYSLKKARIQLLQILGLTCMGSTFYFMFFGYMPNYLAQYFHIPLLKSLSCQAVLLLAMLVFLPLGGWCGDRYGRKKILMVSALGIMILTVPCFYLLQHNNLILIGIGLAIPAILSSLEQSNNIITFVENCPPNIRYTAISFGYNTGNALFGGTAPFVFGVLSQLFHPLSAVYYLIFMSLISFITILTIKNQSEFNRSYSIESV